MTAQDKKDRREARHTLMAAVRKHHFSLPAKLVMTPAQTRANVRKVTDQLFAGKNPHEAEIFSY